MSKLKKLVLLSIMLFLIVPVIVMLYSVLLFGNTPTDNQKLMIDHCSREVLLVVMKKQHIQHKNQFG